MDELSVYKVYYLEWIGLNSIYLEGGNPKHYSIFEKHFYLLDSIIEEPTKRDEFIQTLSKLRHCKSDNTFAIQVIYSIMAEMIRFLSEKKNETSIDSFMINIDATVNSLSFELLNYKMQIIEHPNKSIDHLIEINEIIRITMYIITILRLNFEKVIYKTNFFNRNIFIENDICHYTGKGIKLAKQLVFIYHDLNFKCNQVHYKNECLKIIECNSKNSTIHQYIKQYLNEPFEKDPTKWINLNENDLNLKNATEYTILKKHISDNKEVFDI